MAAVDDLGDNPDWMAGIAERKIQDAIDEGLFDNLPGQGQPLDLSANPFEPPGMGAINRLLKHNRVLPPWLLIEHEIEAGRALALGVLARWEASEINLRETRQYSAFRAKAREAYARHLKETNDLILKYNYSSPFSYRVQIPFLQKRRLAEFDELYGTDKKEAEL